MSPFDHGPAALPPAALSPDGRRQRLDALRSRIAPYETVVPDVQNRLRLGALDAVLPWGGLPCGALHQITGTGLGGGTALGFGLALLSSHMHFNSPKISRFSDAYKFKPKQNENNVADIVWVSCRDDLFGPGIAWFGIAPSRLLMIHANSAEQVLSTIEESLHCPSLCAVIGETDALDLTNSRRLQLAAAHAPATALFVIGPASARGTGTTAALTRWRVAAVAPWAADPAEHVPPRLIGPRRWQVELERCRGGRPGRWLMEWNDATHTLAMAAQPRH